MSSKAGNRRAQRWLVRGGRRVVSGELPRACGGRGGIGDRRGCGSRTTIGTPPATTRRPCSDRDMLVKGRDRLGDAGTMDWARPPQRKWSGTPAETAAGSLGAARSIRCVTPGSIRTGSGRRPPYVQPAVRSSASPEASADVGSRRCRGWRRCRRPGVPVPERPHRGALQPAQQPGPGLTVPRRWGAGSAERKGPIAGRNCCKVLLTAAGRRLEPRDAAESPPFTAAGPRSVPRSWHATRDRGQRTGRSPRRPAARGKPSMGLAQVSIA